MKKQFITRVFLSSLVLALTSLFGGGNLLAQTEVFYESFNKCAGKGGNDGTWSGITTSATLTTDNKGWTFEKGNGASACARFGTGSALGSATTPALSFEGVATLTFKAGAWNGKSENTTLKISIAAGSGSLGSSSVTLNKGSFETYTITITGASTDTKIKFEGFQKDNSRFFLDEVKITQASSSDPGDTRTDPELAYAVKEYNATIGQKEGFPTLSNPHDVTVSYSSSNKTVATVDESGNVTLKGEGKTTITASFSGNDDWKAGSASYTLIVSKPSANLTYSASSCYVVIGEDYTLPKLTYTEGVTGIVFASSDESVATVDAEGVVSLTGAVGTTTITASLTGDATYADGSASYELTVKKPNVFVYKKVTSAEDLIKGATYVFVCEGTNKVGTAVSDKKMQPTNATLTDGILEESVDEPMEFVLDIKDGKYCFISGGKYLKGADGTDLTMVSYSTIDEAIKWNILFDEVKGALIWNTYGANNGTGRRLMYRSSKDYNVFGHYAGKIGTEYYNVQLYQKVYPLTVSSATGGYATFYNEEEAYKMPEGLTGYAVTKAENGNYITRKTAYEVGATVPAKTPLLIIGQANSYYPAVVSGTGVEAYAGSNLLEGKRDAKGNTLSAKDGSVYYYKLGLNSESKPGFYWGADNGAAFKMKKATTAYLAIPQAVANGANALFFDFGPETGINEIQTEQADKAIFDLSGRRVKKATKGFYIVGGKKVLVK